VRGGGGIAGLVNVLKAWLLLVGACALFGGIGFAVAGYRGFSVLVFCVLMLAGAVYWYADRVVIGMVGARELPLGEAPLLHSTVARLAATARVAKPKLYVIADGHPRALAAGRSPRGASLVLSAGLVSALTPAELEGVIAHEIAHLARRDVTIQTTAVVVAAALVETSRIGGWLERALLVVLGPVAAAVVHLMLSPKRELGTDRAAARLCGSPHGLADALVRLEQASELVDFRASPVTEPLYTINPFADEGLAALFASHPPIAERVRRLRELDPGWRERLRAA
jgi:heat shock protein HtpX